MYDCKVEISARHVHLSQEDFQKLFFNQELKSIKKLSQGDDFSAEETVDLSGPKGKIEKVRIVGPFREKTQVEITYSESRLLGINPPLKISGDLPGAAITICGPRGKIESDAAIIAKRHLHISPERAKEINLNDGDVVGMKFEGDRSIVFLNILVRIREGFEEAVHLDTDEANAAGMVSCSIGKLIHKDEII